MVKNLGSTIYDVATEAKVSIATVSRFLNTPEKVGAATVLRIQHAVDKLAYIHHGNAGTRSSRRIGRIGVLTPYFSAPSFVKRLEGVATVMRHANFEMIIYTVDSPEQLAEYLRSIPFSRRLDGLIVMSMPLSDDDSRRLVDSGLEVVAIEHHNQRFSSVECDNMRGGALAARHFLSKNYTVCAYIGDTNVSPFALHPNELRFQGYQEALAQAGHAMSPSHIRLGAVSVEDGLRMARELLEPGDRPRAIFAMSDLQAFGIMKAARQLKLRVPEDVAIMGFDDIDAAGYMELSTVSQSLYESGRLAADLLLSLIREPDRPLQNIQIKVDVVERATT